MALQRYKEGRNFESRSHDHIMFGRPQVAHFDIFYNFPKQKMPPGMLYVWANIDTDNLTLLWTRGYRYVPASRHPEYTAHQFSLSDPRYIYKKRQVLMEINEDLFRKLKHHQLTQANNQKNSIERQNTAANNSALLGGPQVFNSYF